MSSVALEMNKAMTVGGIEHPVLNALSVINGDMLEISVLNYMVALLVLILFTLMRLSLSSLVALHSSSLSFLLAVTMMNT